ncbi:glycoside hydrolase family 128 protein [Hypoxylon sp. FL1284]|nr:glycoside hydrolase family 128 protein [Hypoxylon sp. FL1284]
MVFLPSPRQIAYMAACLLFASPSLAAPVETTSELAERASGGKRIILWETSLTNSLQSSPNLLASAKALGSSNTIKSVTNWETKRPTENDLISVLKSQKNTIVHFFNEPERNNIGVQQALDAWRQKMLPLRKHAWLQQFMSQLKQNEKPDYLNLHFYTLQQNSADQEIGNARKYFSGKHGDYNIPVIIGEIACTSRDAAQSWVLEYGVFGVSTKVDDNFVSPAAQLLNAKGGWTDLGKWYIGK